MKELWTVAEVCRAVHVSRSLVYEWVATEKIPHFKVNGLIRFDPDDVARWLESCRSDCVLDSKVLLRALDRTLEGRVMKGRG
ncbi:MAG: helix-turn-helix domain-containing protein [Thermodesulfobacteriota bacterium]